MWLAARLPAQDVPRAGLPADAAVGRLALTLVLVPGLGQQRERRHALDQLRAGLPGPAVRAGQARARAVGRRPAGPQGEARPAHRVAAAAGPADARRGRAGPAGDAGSDLGTTLVLLTIFLGAAVGRRRARPAVRRHGGAGVPAGVDPHHRRAVPDAAADRLPRPVRQPARPPTTRASRACTRSRPAACSAPGSARAAPSGTTCPRPRPTSSSRSSARSSGSSAPSSSCPVRAARLRRAADRAAGRRTRSCRLAAAGATAWLVGAGASSTSAPCIGVLPITGIPLPLVSYGGSALIPTPDRARHAARRSPNASPAPRQALAARAPDRPSGSKLAGSGTALRPLRGSGRPTGSTRPSGVRGSGRPRIDSPLRGRGRPPGSPVPGPSRPCARTRRRRHRHSST